MKNRKYVIWINFIRNDCSEWHGIDLNANICFNSIEVFKINDSKNVKTFVFKKKVHRHVENLSSNVCSEKAYRLDSIRNLNSFKAKRNAELELIYLLIQYTLTTVNIA